MAGLSKLVAKELSAALGITDNPKFNPMFKQMDEVMADVADPSDPTVARFYSPLESAIDEAPIGKQGTRGENVEAFVRKRAPKVSKAEMEFRGLGLEPGELYTAESAKESLKGLNIKAVKRGREYRLEQRQSNLKDKQSDYVELSIEAEEDLNYPPAYHYGSSNLAHTRYSVREPSELKEPEIVRGGNKPYILIEELQSDVIQNTAENAQEAAARHSQVLNEDLNMEYNAIRFQINDEGSGFPDKVVDDIKYYIEDVVIPTNLNTKLSDSDKIKVYQKALKRIDADQDIIEGVGKAGDVFPTVNSILQREFDEFDDLMEEVADDINDTVSIYLQTVMSVVSKKDLPVQRITDSIRMSLQAIISDAKARGIDEIVLPPVDKLAYQRFRLDEIPSKIAKGSAFYNTYVASYNKVLKQLKSELGNQIKIGKKPLKYRTHAGKISARTAKGKVLNKPPKYETVQGTLLDISNLTIDPSKIKLRFNKGGLVQRPNK